MKVYALMVTIKACQQRISCVNDAVEAHSCVDPLMPNSFLSKNTTVNDKSTAGRFDPKVFVNCVQDKE